MIFLNKMTLPLPSFMSDTTTLLLFVTTFCVSFISWRSTRRRHDTPPGPGPRLPLIGHIHLLGKDPRCTFKKWRKEYGDVFSYYQGSKLVVVLSGYKVLREALVRKADAFSGRPKAYWSEVICKYRGLSSATGDTSKEQRKISLQVLGHLGLGKNSMQDHILGEVHNYLQHIHDFQGAPVDLWNLTRISFSNNISSILFGKQFAYDDPIMVSCMKTLDEALSDLFVPDIFDFVPFKDRFPGDPFHWHSLIRQFLYIENTLIWPCIHEQKERMKKKGTGDEKGEREEKEEEEDEDYTNFIQGYLKEVRRQERTGIVTSVNETSLAQALSDLWAAGMETSATALCWLMVHLARYPHIQDRCFQDVLRVVGTARPPCVQDRSQMVYLEATILECLRYSAGLPFALAHNTAYEVNLLNYVIPKDTMILPNIDSALHDKETWGDPDVFRPERFISEEGELLHPDELITFSLGRRQCLGKHMAMMEVYLYLASLLQRFQILPPDDGALPSDKGMLALVMRPEPFKIRLVPRN